jgi:hypothetical protein
LFSTSIKKPRLDQMMFPSQNTPISYVPYLRRRSASSTTLRARLTNQDGLATLDFYKFVSTVRPYLASQSSGCLTAEAMRATQNPAYGAGGYRRISSKYILPEPPACGLFLSPNPRAIVLTFARFMPNACRSIVHCVQLTICAASGLS